MSDEEFYRCRTIEEGWYKIGSRQGTEKPIEVDTFWHEFRARYGNALYGIMDDPTNPIYQIK